MRHCTIRGDGLAALAGRVSSEGVDCVLVSAGAFLAALLGRLGRRRGCLEKRIGRQLVASDFIEVGGEIGQRSVRLQSRLLARS